MVPIKKPEWKKNRSLETRFGEVVLFERKLDFWTIGQKMQEHQWRQSEVLRGNVNSLEIESPTLAKLERLWMYLTSNLHGILHH